MSESKQQQAPAPVPKKKPAYLQYAFGGSAGLVKSSSNYCLLGLAVPFKISRRKPSEFL